MPAAAHLPRLAAPFLVFSLVTNLAVLVSPVFMMQVLDRVVPSGNIATLVLLAALAFGALAVQALVDTARDIIRGRIARWMEHDGLRRAMECAPDAARREIEQSAGIARVIEGPVAIAALSAPWLPLFAVALYLVHPAFVALLVVLVAAAAMVRLAGGILAGDDADAATQLAARQAAVARQAADFAARSGDAIVSRNLLDRFARLQAQRHAALDTAERYGHASRAAEGFLRGSGQIAALGLGAYLVTIDAMSAGGMIAGSIIVSRTLQGVDGLMSHGARIRDAYRDIRGLRDARPDAPAQATGIDSFEGALTAEGLVVPRGSGAPPRLDRVGFRLAPGECLAVVGGSGSGKTTLLRALAGIEPAPIGSVFLDESEVRTLPAKTRHRQIGYLPQRADLLPVSVRDNICSFAPDAEDARIVAAARAAGVHGLISALPAGYDTDLGAAPHLLSAGQGQRVALARALYAGPRYLLLDEPNALLDADGERALLQTLERLKSGGTTIVMVLHRSGLMGLADKVLRLDGGRVADFGRRAEVLGRLGMGQRQVRLPLREASLQDLRDWIASQFTRTGDEALSQTAQIVGAELFLDALAAGPADSPRMATVVFRFIDDTHCEMTLEADCAEDPGLRLEAVRATASRDGGFLGDLPGELVSLATVDRLAERFDIHSDGQATRFAVRLGAARTTAPTPAKPS